MRPYDAAFLALFAGCVIARPRGWWLVAAAPVLAYGLGCVATLQRFEAPLIALAAVLLAPRWAAVPLLLVLPEYPTLAHSVGTGALWLGLTVLYEGLLGRLSDEHVPPRLRGLPVRLLLVVGLYYTLLPLQWL